MSSFYAYKEEPDILAEYKEPSKSFEKFFVENVYQLVEIGRIAYFLHLWINGRAFPRRAKLSKDECIQTCIRRLHQDFVWAEKQSFQTRIQICDHIEHGFGISLRLGFRHRDAVTQGWMMLEQVILRQHRCFHLWSYSDD